MSSRFAVKQEERLLSITSPLGADVLVLRKLRVEEALSQPFAIDAEVVTEQHGLKPADIVGKTITCTVSPNTTAPRHFNGYVRAMERVGTLGRNLSIFRLQAVPRLWNMTRTADCRIFQDKTVKQIVDTLLQEAGVSDRVWNTGLAFKARPYVVQYNETDFDFLQRLLAEIGVGYCFRHSGGKHEMVLCHAAGDWPQASGVELTVHPTGSRKDALETWRSGGAAQPGRAVSVDTDLLRFTGRDEKSVTTAIGFGGGAEFELFLSPGGQAVQADANPARMLIEAAEAEAETVEAAGRHPLVFAGARISVDAADEAGETGSFLVTRVLHEAYDETHLAGEGTADYRNSFSAMPAARPWRPKRAGGRPAIPGLQRAIVTGPAGEEIHTDENGRIKIRFLWDRYGKQDDTSSCWVRVLQPVAGAWGGTWFLPRMGDEVLVGFIDGEADRPVIVGSLYNAEATPLWALPGQKTRTGIRTRSSKGGGASNFNMISLDDKMGSELFEVQAEKDLKILVKNDRTEHVKQHRTETIDGKHTETVKLDFSTTVTQGNQQLVVKTGNIDTKAEMGNIGTLAKLGNIDTKASLGAITVEAMQSITLKVGQSSVKIDQTGITLEGMMITAKAQMTLTTEGGLMATHKAGAMMTIKAGLVMIN